MPPRELYQKDNIIVTSYPDKKQGRLIGKRNNNNYSPNNWGAATTDFHDDEDNSKPRLITADNYTSGGNPASGSGLKIRSFGKSPW
jgi:hypothetical protein